MSTRSRYPLVLLFLGFSLVVVSAIPVEPPPAFLITWGTEGDGDDQFYWPYGMAIDVHGKMYVADTNNHRVQKYDSSGTQLGVWGWGVQDGSPAFQICTSSCQKGTAGAGDRQFTWPSDVAVDAMGNVYVVDMDNDRIQKLDSDGALLSMWGWGVDDGSDVYQICTSGCEHGIAGEGDGQFKRAASVAVGPGGKIYVTDVENHRVQKLDNDGTYLDKWGANGSSAGQFSEPYGVGVDASGDVFVVDTNNHRVQKFDGSGTFLDEWGTQGSQLEQFYWPFGVAVDSGGNVYVADRNNNRDQKFDGSGKLLSSWGEYGSGDGQFNFPRDVATDTAGHIYVLESANHRIQKFGGPWLDVFVGEPELPHGR